jgi:uncharacterized protein YdgA (DUF945 family)
MPGRTPAIYPTDNFASVQRDIMEGGFRERTMKKGLVIAGVAIAVLYPVTAWLMGYVIERRIDEFQQRLNDQNPYVKVSDVSFHRGWFTSDQELTLEPARLPFAAESLRVTVHNTIHHGPICGLTCIGLASVDSHLVFNEEMQARVAAIFGGAEPLRITSRLGLFGGGSAHVSSPAFKDAVISGASLASDGIVADSKYTGNLDTYSTQASVGRLSYAGKDGQRFEVSNIAIDVHSKRALRTLYTGDSSFSIGRIAYGNAAGTGVFTAADIRVNSHAEIADGFMRAEGKYNLGAVQAGPVALTSTKMDISFRHLDADSLERLTAQLREVNRDVAIAPQDRSATMLGAIKAPMMSLLEKQPEIGIDQIVIATAAGSSSISGSVKFKPLVAGDFDGDAGAKALIKKVDIELDVSIDDAFLNSLPGGQSSTARLQPFVSQGLATHDNGKFHTIVGFHDGQATFNGKTFGPPAADKKP